MVCILLAVSAETKEEKVLEKLFLFKSIWVSSECSIDMLVYGLHCMIKAENLVRQTLKIIHFDSSEKLQLLKNVLFFFYFVILSSTYWKYTILRHFSDF